MALISNKILTGISSVVRNKIKYQGSSADRQAGIQSAVLVKEEI